MIPRSGRRLCLALATVATLALILSSSQSVQAQHQGNGSGFMSSLFSPFTSSLRHARRLLGGGAEGQEDHTGGDALNSPSSPSFASLRDRAFKVFAQLYNKSYSPEELPKRMQLFFERRREIEASMRAYAQGKLPFMMRENAYVDWDAGELRTLTGVAPPKRPDEFTPEDREALARASREIRRRKKRSATSESASGNLEYELEGNQTTLDEWADEFDFELEDKEENEDENESSLEEDPNLLVQAPEQIPAAVDWRSSGCVARPINQHKCGACYAIATMGVLETMRCLNRVSSPTLAPQQVVDCSRAYNNFGCNGGWPTRVLKYLQDTRVAAREACYPFVRRELTCRLRQVQSTPGAGCTVAASPTDSQLHYKVLNNERDILYHVARTGPVVTVMRATDKFLYYGSGIFDDLTCSRRRDDVDHAIVIVGYGRQNGQDYWLIKNSWGESWGQQGYGLYKRGTNACSIGHWGWVITS